MSAVVADTHIVVWYLVTPGKLTRDALEAMDGADAAGEPIYISVISLVEIIYLIEKGRLPETLLERLLDEVSRPDSALSLVPLYLPIAQALRRVARTAVPEMPDRIIGATALHLDLPLVTADERLRAAGIATIW